MSFFGMSRYDISCLNTNFRGELSFEELLGRIISERQFLTLTEESLATEEMEEEEDLEEETEAGKDDKNVRQELQARLRSALNETSLSMDFVSLLMSGANPTVAKATISPQLMKNVPLGSLGSDRTHDGPVENLEKDLKIGQGWKAEAVTNIIDSFKSAAETVRIDIENQKKYWDTMNLVLSNGDVLFRAKDSKSVGIKYGYGDSGSIFHDAGLGILQFNPDSGDVQFECLGANSKVTPRTYKYVRVTLLKRVDDEYTILGLSRFTPQIERSHKVLTEIEKARLSLFEEDMLYFLIREAQLLISYNVSIVSNKIIIEVNNHIIEVESAPFRSEDENEVPELNYLKSAQLILNYMRLMLCCFYKYNLSLRQRLPTTYTKQKQKNSHPLILRPFLGLIRHENAILEITTKLEHLKNELDAELTFTVEKFANLNDHSGDPFQKAVQIPKSQIDLTVKKSLLSCLKASLIITSSEIFVDRIIKLNIVSFKSMDDLKNNFDGSNILQEELNHLDDLVLCLKWPILTYLEE